MYFFFNNSQNEYLVFNLDEKIVYHYAKRLEYNKGERRSRFTLSIRKSRKIVNAIICKYLSISVKIKLYTNN